MPVRALALVPSASGKPPTMSICHSSAGPKPSRLALLRTTRVVAEGFVDAGQAFGNRLERFGQLLGEWAAVEIVDVRFCIMGRRVGFYANELSGRAGHDEPGFKLTQVSLR